MQRGRGGALATTPTAPRPESLAPPSPQAGPALRTHFDFELPLGFVDAEGMVHRQGTMRLATARDELLPLYDARVQENAAFTTVVLLARVITRLGELPSVDTTVVENMFASDVAFLQDLYRRTNQQGHTRAAIACPSCQHAFSVDVSSGSRLGES